MQLKYGKNQNKYLRTDRLSEQIKLQNKGEIQIEENGIRSVNPSPYLPKANDTSTLAGFLTRPDPNAFPVLPSGKEYWNRYALTGAGTHSSGNCRRLSRHSLLIPTGIKNRFRNQCAAKVIYFFSKNTLLRKGIFRSVANRSLLFL